jgi:hypothetical protein
MVCQHAQRNNSLLFYMVCQHTQRNNSLLFYMGTRGPRKGCREVWFICIPPHGPYFSTPWFNAFIACLHVCIILPPFSTPSFSAFIACLYVCVILPPLSTRHCSSWSTCLNVFVPSNDCSILSCTCLYVYFCPPSDCVQFCLVLEDLSSFPRHSLLRFTFSIFENLWKEHSLSC